MCAWERPHHVMVILTPTSPHTKRLQLFPYLSLSPSPLLYFLSSQEDDAALAVLPSPVFSRRERLQTGNRIYWALTHTTNDRPLRIAITQRLVFSLKAFTALLGNGSSSGCSLCPHTNLLLFYLPTKVGGKK
jgi:hypothetical protein